MGNELSSRRFQNLAERTSVNVLRPSSRQVIANALGKEGVLYNGRFNDYRGFLELAQCTNDEIDYYTDVDPSKVRCMVNFLENWVGVARCKGQDTPTILTAWLILVELGRMDIIECCKTVVEDVKVHNQTHRSDAGTFPFDGPCITMDDVKYGTRIIHDAFVMSDPSDDDFLRRLIDQAEGDKHRLKLLVPERDLLYGSPVLDTWAYAIEKRCRKLILLISRKFIESEKCEFVVKFATALNPAAKDQKIIPVKLDGSRVPPILNFVRFFTPTINDLTLLITQITSPMLRTVRSTSCPDSTRIASVMPFRCGQSSPADALEERCITDLSRLRLSERHSLPEIKCEQYDINTSSPVEHGMSQARVSISLDTDIEDDNSSNRSDTSYSSSYCVVNTLPRGIRKSMTGDQDASGRRIKLVLDNSATLSSSDNESAHTEPQHGADSIDWNEESLIPIKNDNDTSKKVYFV